MERTLVILKPGTLQRGLVGEVISRFENPVILCCWEGFEAVKVVREMAGATNARKAAPGTIRGDYALSAQENIVHTSDSPENARIELDRFFSPEDYCEYPSPLNQYLYAPDEK